MLPNGGTTFRVQRKRGKVTLLEATENINWRKFDVIMTISLKKQKNKHDRMKEGRRK